MTPLGLGLGLGLGAQSQRPQKDMILVYEIPSAGTPIQLAIQANSTWFSAGQAVVINWGDGSAAKTVSATSGHTGYIGHTYAAEGTYTIKISGSMTKYGRGAYTEDLNGQQLLTHIHSFGELGITSLAYAFNGCSRIVSVPKTLPDSVENMTYMFRNCIGAAFNPDVTNWDVSKVTSMYAMFYGCRGAAFRGGRGVDGSGIANWQLKTGNNAVNMNSFMLSSKTQDPPFLDDILNAWAALHAQGKLPTNITVSFGNNKYTATGATAYTTLTNDAGWTIASGGLQA